MKKMARKKKVTAKAAKRPDPVMGSEEDFPERLEVKKKVARKPPRKIPKGWRSLVEGERIPLDYKYPLFRTRKWRNGSAFAGEIFHDQLPRILVPTQPRPGRGVKGKKR